MSELHESRLAKLQKIEEMGIDPWGGRFADRSWNADVRERAVEVQFRLANGELLDLPDFAAQAGEPVDYRELKERGTPL